MPRKRRFWNEKPPSETPEQQRERAEDALRNEISSQSADELVEAARKSSGLDCDLASHLLMLAEDTDQNRGIDERDAALACVEAAITEILLRKLGSKKCDLWEFVSELRDPNGNSRYSHADIMLYLWQDKPPAQTAAWSLAPMLWAWREMILFSFLRLRTNPRSSRGRPQRRMTASESTPTAAPAAADNEVEHCRCYERYAGAPKKSTEMRKACERNHTVASFPEYLRKRGVQEASDSEERDELATDESTRNQVSNRDLAARFLKRAVDGDTNLKNKKGGMFRAFGNSMLCAVFTTPGEKGLYLVKQLVPQNDAAVDKSGRLMKEIDLLVEAGEHELPSDESLPSAESLTPRAELVQSDWAWVCDQCRCMVGGTNDCERTVDCVWSRVPLGAEAVPVRVEPVRVACCRKGHYWPILKSENCPVCQCLTTGQLLIEIPNPQ